MASWLRSVTEHISGEFSKRWRSICTASYEPALVVMQLHNWCSPSIKSKLQKQHKFKWEKNVREWKTESVINRTVIFGDELTTTSLYCWWTLSYFQFCQLSLKPLGILLHVFFFFGIYFISFRYIPISGMAWNRYSLNL